MGAIERGIVGLILKKEWFDRSEKVLCCVYGSSLAAGLVWFGVVWGGLGGEREMKRVEGVSPSTNDRVSQNL